MTDTNTIATKAMLVSLKISNWGASKADDEVSEDVIKQRGAGSDAGRFVKNLIDKKCPEFKAVKKIAGKARNEHYALTLPWQDDGKRILPVKNYDKYSEVIRSLEDDYREAVDKFVAKYTDLVDDARSTLAQMFREGDYPSQSEIEEAFSFERIVEPMPTSADFRVSLRNDEAEKIRAEIDKRARSQIADAQRTLIERVVTTIGKMEERLNAYTQSDEGKTGVFRDSLVENARELAEVLPNMNLTDDPAVDKIAAEIMERLCSHTADDLRKEEGLRKGVAKDAGEIKAKAQQMLDTLTF